MGTSPLNRDYSCDYTCDNAEVLFWLFPFLWYVILLFLACEQKPKVHARGSYSLPQKALFSAALLTSDDVIACGADQSEHTMLIGGWGLKDRSSNKVFQTEGEYRCSV